MSAAPASSRNADSTRQSILMAAFHEFYRNGFQGGSINRIVSAAGITKGALFHHFASKQALGYAVVDEVIEPLLLQRWLDPLNGADDSITVLQDSFNRFVNEDIGSGAWAQGCPLNNLAQEMSPLDPGFRSRIDRLYTIWRAGFSTALTRGITSGHVRSDVNADAVASLLVAGQMGIWGTGKSSQSEVVMRGATGAVCAYLETLRA